MSQKSLNILSYVIKGGIFILPVLSLIVSSDLFFPFITGKAFFFRTIVEILFFLWILLASFDKKYRPKKTPLLFALIAVIAVLTLATIFGVNPSRSFWSNFERMEGLVSHLHLFVYFLILSSVFKKEPDFKWLFVSLLAVSVIISVYAYLQFAGKLTVHQGGTKLDATMGNSTYLAIFIVFHLFIMAWLFLKNSNIWLRSFLAFLFVFEFPIVYYTMTRGAILGFFGGVGIFLVLMAFFSKRKNVRYYFAGAVAGLIIIAGLFILFKNSHFIKSRPTLNKIAAISFKEQTVESRLTIWKMGFEGFKERPVLGWGPENFNIVFNKFYKPNMWKQEPWFDRAHDIFFDWLVSAGVLGFFTYWSVFATSLYMVFKRKGESKIEASLIAGLFAAYSFHNVFVFDNLTSYFLFFTVLSYIQISYLNANKNSNGQIAVPSRTNNTDIGIGKYLFITGAFLVTVFSLYFVNLKPYLAAREILAALRTANQDTNVQNALNEFNQVISYGTFGTPEAREQLSGYATSIINVPQISESDKVKALNTSIKELEEQVKEVPNDARYYLFLGSLYARANRNDDALKTMNKALELSPKKQQIYFVIADVYLAKGDNKKALEIMQSAYNLDKSYDEAAKNLAVVMILNNQKNEAEDLLQKTFGKRILGDKELVNAYARVNDYEKVKEIWMEILKQEPDSAQNHVSLAASYLKLNERENAIKELQKAAELNPQFKKDADYYIGEIRAGRNP